MSDEAETVRATLRVLDVLEFNGVPAAVVTADAVKALASLESQNQALQREVEDKAAILNVIEALLDVDDEHPGWDRIVALQERAEKWSEKWSLFEAWYAESRWMGGPQWDALVAALSPTQETDPE